MNYELNHAIDIKRLDILKRIGQNSFETNDFYAQLMYDRILKDNAYNRIYNENHDNFISENRAGIFSIIDFAIQSNKLFRNSFSEERLKKISAINAQSIISFYTEKTDNGLKITSPMQKFIKFYNSKIKNYPEFL